MNNACFHGDLVDNRQRKFGTLLLNQSNFTNPRNCYIRKFSVFYCRSFAWPINIFCWVKRQTKTKKYLKKKLKAT
jgi:hypothetical protein